LTASPTRPDFRDDINGLRAWAVVAVVLFHFGVPGAGGGFVGVDVFYVISGFLMTGIVVEGLERRAFSLAGFYAARARRIVPALLLLCAVLLAAGWWWLPSPDYQQLGAHATYAAVFLSNLRFAREAGYFDVASHEKWLLHTWSLSVEWQFYVLLPLALIVLWRLRPGRSTVAVAMGVAFAASLAWCVVATVKQPPAAFYLLPSRAWEMLAGGLVYLAAGRRPAPARLRPVLEIGGLALVLAGIVGFDGATSWPGWRALLPVAGAASLLFAARQGSVWTGNRAAQWLGTRSYSLYLWHWPIAVGLGWVGLAGDPVAIACGIGLTLVLGHLSWRFAETPARVRLQRVGTGRTATVFVLAVGLVAGAGAVLRNRDGLPGRLDPAVELAAHESGNRRARSAECLAGSGTTSPSCQEGGPKLSAILIGDSHGDAVITALAAARPTPEDGVRDWTYVSCPMTFGVRNQSPKYTPKEHCGEFLDWMAGQLATVPKDVPLVIVNRASVYPLGHNEPWEHDAGRPLVHYGTPTPVTTPAFLDDYARRLTDSACRLAKDHPVYMVRPLPEMGVDVPKTMSRAAALGRTVAVSLPLAEYRRRHAVVLAAQEAARDRCGVVLLDPVPFLCGADACPGDDHGRPLYYDDDHLSEFGNRRLVPMFAPVFAR